MDKISTDKPRKGVVSALIGSPVTASPKAQASRSKRAQLLLPNELYESVVQKCREQGISFNECVNRLLLEFLS